MKESLNRKRQIGDRSMTQDEIIELARFAGIRIDGFGFQGGYIEEFEAFANLVAVKVAEQKRKTEELRSMLTQPEQDSTCSTTLRLQNKPYPRTCKKCGLGPCIAQPTAQLEQEHDTSSTHLAHCYQGEYPVCKYGDENCPATPKVKTQPEPCDMGAICIGCSPRNADGSCPSSPPQRTWVGLTEEKIKEIWLNGKDHGDDWTDVLVLARSFEAELKESNTSKSHPAHWLLPSLTKGN
tara:strand:+ start:93 stop:806 length:714 start_codon:yes stop_codon:yes gene_type:complete